jgi:hypothetical protein
MVAPIRFLEGFRPGGGIPPLGAEFADFAANVTLNRQERLGQTGRSAVIVNSAVSP